MGLFPWRGSENSTDEDTAGDDQKAYHRELDPIISCQCQDGELFVFEDQLFIERPKHSKFSDKWIALDQVIDVRYVRRFIISYLQIEQAGVDSDEAGLLSTPVDENTLHFGYGKRDCMIKARDEILERLSDSPATEGVTDDS